MRTLAILAGLLLVCGCQQPVPVQQPQNIIVNPGHEHYCPPRQPNVIVVPPAQPCPPPQRPGGIHIDINQCPQHHCPAHQCPPGCPHRKAVGVDVNNIHVHVK